MEDHLSLNDNAQLWFEQDAMNANVHRHSANVVDDGYRYFDLSNTAPKNEESQFQHSLLDSQEVLPQDNDMSADDIVENFNYSSSFLSQIPPAPRQNNYSNTDGNISCLYEQENSWTSSLAACFDLSGLGEETPPAGPWSKPLGTAPPPPSPLKKVAQPHAHYRAVVTPSSRIIKVLHAAGGQDKRLHIRKTVSRLTPSKTWTEGNTRGYLTTIMSPSGHARNIFQQMIKPKVLGGKTFAPTSAVMVTSETTVRTEDPPPPQTPTPAPAQPASPELLAPRAAILPTSFPNVGRSPQLHPVTRNTIFGHKKLKYRCNACAYREATLTSLLTHVKAHGLPYCGLCALVVTTTKQLSAHTRKVHNNAEPRDTVTVTSKYGRRRHVLSSVAFAQNRLYPKRQVKGGNKS